jgi:hypothetical protein
VALPLVESLLPRSARAQAGGVPKRLVYWFIPNGVIDKLWIPSSVGPLTAAALPASLQPLADAGVVGDVNILSGVDNLCGYPVALGDHASGIAAMLTCVPAKKAALSDLGLGPSADQIAAGTLGQLTARPSLELGMSKSGSTGDCDNGYACAYAQSISWVDAVTPRGKRTDPHDAWLYLIGTSDPSLSAEQRDRLRRGDKSVLDYVLSQANGLKKKLGSSDRPKVDQYLTSVRAMEQQLTAKTAATCKTPPDPGNSSDYPTRFGQMMDVMEFALTCDLTRVITFMLGNAFGPGPMPWIGVGDDYHALTHRMGEVGVPDLVAKCILWEVQQVAAFIKRLQAIPEGSNSVLYNTSFLVTSDVGEGGPHNHDNMPVLLAGNGGGAFTSGRYLAYAPEDPSARKLAGTRDLDSRTKALAIPNTNRLANLHLSLLKWAGVGIDKFGDSTGTLSQL